MNALGAFAGTPLAGILGWALLHSLWEGVVAAVALGAVLVATRSPRVRYAAACLAMLAILGSFAATVVRLLPASDGRMPRAAQLLAVPVPLGAGADASAFPGGGLAAAVPWLAPFWIAGVWVFCLRHAASWFSVSRLRRRGVCSAPRYWQAELARLKSRLCVSRPVLLLESCLADVPVVIGHVRPVILVPLGLLGGLPPAQIEAILLHELAHIRRWDYLANVFQRALETVFFYHPAVWWISRVVRTERENCCDDAAVALTGRAHEYAAALAALEENRLGPQPAVAVTGGSLVKRIRRLLAPAAPAGAPAPFLSAAILFATAAVGLAAWPSEAPHQPVRQQQADASAPGPFQRWVDQDVVYIITPEERLAFERLRTAEEREKFVEQFWLRRDPSPGTPENEFKEEHYRRIAYANDRYAVDKPGWKTARGRIYIIFGPADEIESHPSGSGGKAPFEVWRYRHIDGIGDNIDFEFQDKERNGHYELVAKPGVA